MLNERYKKNVLIDEIGVEGQVKLLNSSVLIIGCGGLASSVIPFIAASGIGNITLVDDDVVELSNLNRQIIYKTSDVNKMKVNQAKDFINQLNPDVLVKDFSLRFDTRNFADLFVGIDLVLDCTDRLAIKLLIHDACLIFHKPLIYSTAIGFIGQVLTIPSNGKPCLRCFFEKKKMTLQLNCSNSPIFAPTLGIIGSLVAAETIKYFISMKSHLIGGLQVVDLKTNSFNIYKFEANDNCIGCGDKQEIDPYDLSNYEGKF